MLTPRVSRWEGARCPSFHCCASCCARDTKRRSNWNTKSIPRIPCPAPPSRWGLCGACCRERKQLSAISCQLSGVCRFESLFPDNRENNREFFLLSQEKPRGLRVFVILMPQNRELTG